MSPVPIRPDGVPSAIVRRLSVVPEQAPAARQVTVAQIAAPHVVPRQIDPVGLRIMALMLENQELRSELDQLRTG